MRGLSGYESPRVISFLPQLLAAAVLFYQNASPNEPAFQVICEGDLPFSRAELEAALRPRWRLLGRPPERPILVRDLGDGAVAIEVGPGKREIGLQGQTSESATRIVALLAVDLLAESTLEEETRPATLPAAPGRTTLDAEVRVPFLAQGWTATIEPTVGLGIRVFTHLSLGASLGYTSLAAGTGQTSLRWREIPVRAGIGYSTAWLDLHAGAVLRPYFVSGAGAHQGIHGGASLSATAYLGLTRHLAIAVSAGLDGLYEQTELRVDGQTMLSTRRLVPWLGAGIALRRSP